ncbi:hypothetical protein [Candidatus Hodgkinia cicadicola]|uniref:hypothetical protein n=1 Tax=Candidatus Hodgkinia cicadicola TaxID=573658 RepID=UPI0011BA501E
MFELNLLELIFLTSWKVLVKRLIKNLLWYFNSNTNKVNQRLSTQDRDTHEVIPSRSELIR